MKGLQAREGVIAALSLFFILNLCFAPALWGSKTLLNSARMVPSVLPNGAWEGKPLARTAARELDPGAPGWVAEPDLAVIRNDLRSGTLPLWNPYGGYGTPFAANMQSGAFFPLVVLESAFLGPTTYNWMILFRLFVLGIGTYFYLRLFLSHLAGLAGAITAMLGGYYLLYLTMFHLNVEMLLPAGLWAMERLVRERSYRRFLWLVIIVWLILIGGAPESALLVLTFVYLYLVYRVWSDATLRPEWLAITKLVILSVVTAAALSAFLIAPFWEFLQHSFDVHQSTNVHGALPGLDHDGLDKGVFTSLFPLLFGPPQGPAGWSGIRGYLGIVALFFALIAVGSAIWKKERSEVGRLTWFFLFFALAVPLKRYGFFGLNWIGSLPLYRLVGFPKYGEALLAVSAAILCAFGVEELLNGKASNRLRWLAWSIALFAIPFTVAWCRLTEHRGFFHSGEVRWALGLPFVLMCLLAGLLLFYGKDRRRLAIGILLLLTCEASLSYIVPAYYSISRMASASSNPYAGAPFVRVLQRQSGFDRVFARDEVLYPNWSSAFQLADIRDLDAMYNKKYFRFLTAFLPEPTEHRVGAELFDRFTGDSAYEFATQKERRLLQLSSVKYIASLHPYPDPNAIVEAIIERNQGHLLPGREALIEEKRFEIDGSSREVLGEHPPYERLPYSVKVGQDVKVFHFAIALDPAAFTKAGDGVGFQVEVEDAAGKITKVFYRYIDPKHDVDERHWNDGQFDVSAYRGQTVQFLFSTDPGPKGDTSYDWAAWSDFHFDDHQENQARFRRIYNNEAKIYHYDDVLPRAGLYYHAELRSSDDEVLRTLSGPGTNIYQAVILNRNELTREEYEAILAMNSSPEQTVQAATVTHYNADRVDIQATLDRSGLLMLNDSSYPGWLAEVDGHASDILNADYLFRGVFLKPGKHSVIFKYKPKSFYFGAVISLVALACVGGAGMLKKLSFF